MLSYAPTNTGFDKEKKCLKLWFTCRACKNFYRRVCTTRQREIHFLVLILERCNDVEYR